MTSDLQQVPRVQVDKVFTPDDRRSALWDETFWNLREIPKQLSPTWLYDEQGSQLFDEITRLPEYYPFRAERSILVQYADAIAAATAADTLVELGSGTSEKTQLLLGALHRSGSLRVFAPLDVSEEILVASANAVAERYAGVGVHAVVGDFERHLGTLPRDGRRLVAFLGSTIGNLYPTRRGTFLARLAAALGDDDSFLLGIDLEKDVGRLEAAYNDSLGLTERFVRNGLAAVDQELGSTFATAEFDYSARWSDEHHWIDLGFVSRSAQTIAVPQLEVEVSFAPGEPLRVEVSTKFTVEQIERELADAGLALTQVWTDEAGDFALCLARPAPTPA
jgi:L-histidine Nalpha-methyltransferase